MAVIWYIVSFRQNHTERPVRKAEVALAKIMQARPGMDAGHAVTMLGLLTLVVLDGKPLTGTPSVQASHEEIMSAVNRILQDESYEPGSGFPYTRREMQAQIAYDNIQSYAELDEEGHKTLSQIATYAEKEVVEQGKNHNYTFSAGEACALLALCAFTLLQEENTDITIPDDAVGRVLSTIAREILEEPSYQPSPDFPFTKEEMSEATEQADEQNLERHYIKLHEAGIIRLADEEPLDSESELS